MGYPKGTVFFFFRGHGRWSFIHSNPKIVSREAGKKNTAVFFFFPRKSSSVIQSDFDEVSFFFNKSCLYFFFPGILRVFLFFSFPRKSSSVIHSFDFFGGKKKNKPEKKKNSFFIHSFEIPQKCEKTNFSGEIKKYGTFVHAHFFFHGHFSSFCPAW